MVAMATEMGRVTAGGRFPPEATLAGAEKLGRRAEMGRKKKMHPIFQPVTAIKTEHRLEMQTKTQESR